MSDQKKSERVIWMLTALFLGLAGAFLLNLWGKPPARVKIPPTPAVFSNPATVRFSARQLVEAEADTSGMACYSCHEEGVVREVPRNENGDVVLPKAHLDLIYSRMNCAACHDETEGVEIAYDDDGNVVIPAAHRTTVPLHGETGRNNNCYNCHVSTNLALVRTASGEQLPLTESTLLCASCHGPTYRDWVAGTHGRSGGFWDQALGTRSRTDCTSCHDPHSPPFPSMKPGPAPHSPPGRATTPANHERPESNV